VFPEGDLFFIMQVCPDVFRAGGCAQEFRCDCWQSDAGPLWQFRGYAKSRAEAEERERVLSLRFWNDVERSRARSESKPTKSSAVPVLCGVPRRAFVVLDAEDGSGCAVLRVCADVLQVGECRDALVCSCEHSDAGPLRVELRKFPARHQADEFARIRQAEFDADPVALLQRWEARPVVPSAGDGVPCSAEAWAAFHSIDPGDVPY
jgi:hypothetical protein